MLDLDEDGFLSRSDLNKAAKRYFNTLTGFLENTTCTKVAVQYQPLLENLEIASISAEDAALLILLA